MFPHADGKILNDEIVIIHFSGPTSKLEVFEPNAWVCLPGVFGDVGGWSEMLRERCSPNTPAKAHGPGPSGLGLRSSGQ